MHRLKVIWESGEGKQYTCAITLQLFALDVEMHTHVTIKLIFHKI